MVSAAVESVDSPPLDVGPPEHAGSVPAVDSMPAADVDGALSTTVGKISSAEGSELEQPVGVAGEQGAAVTGVVEETTGAVEDAAVDVPGAKAPSSAALSEVPEVGGVDQAGVTVDNATEVSMAPCVYGRVSRDSCIGLSYCRGSVEGVFHFFIVCLCLLQGHELSRVSQQGGSRCSG